jgi:hypothetical protein
MHEHGSLPRARQDGLLEETVGEELLLYDQNSHTAHCLSPIAACVWRHCDGERDLAELAQLAGTSENLAADALHELREKDLLAAEPQLMPSTIPGESRREAIGRVARYGAAAATPFIVSAAVATPAMAASVATCCQCYKKAQFKEPCACTTVAEYTMNNGVCEEFCRSENGKPGPVCSDKVGSGQLTGTKCGSKDECE